MSKLLATLLDGKICDFIDQKIRNDTPEEHVRQNIERWLVLELGYSLEQIEVEYSIKQGSKTIRADLVIFREGDSHHQKNVWIIIECKKDYIQPSATNDDVEHLRSYMAACDNLEWGMWTNGKKKSVLHRIRTEEGIEYEEPNDIPCFKKKIPKLQPEMLQKNSTPDVMTYHPDALPIWELAAQLSAQVPDEEWKKLPTDLSQNFDFYQKKRQGQD